MSKSTETLLPKVTGGDIVDRVYRSLLLTAMRDAKSEDLKKRAVKAFEKHYGAYFPAIQLEEPAPLLVMGPPGQGKTSCIVQACKKVSEDLGLNFVTSADLTLENRAPNEHDFVLAVHSLGGEISSVTLNGLPTKVERGDGEDTLEYTGNVPYKMYAQVLDATQKGGFGLVFFDDVTNAAPHILTILYNVVEEAEFNGNPFPYCVLAGNEGRKDGNSATNLPSALVNRSEAVYYSVQGDENTILNIFRDKIKDFKADGLNTRTGEALHSIMSLLRNNPDIVSTPAASGRVKSPQTTPRSLENSLVATILQGLDGTQDSRFLHNMHTDISSLCGKETAKKIMDFHESISPMYSKFRSAAGEQDLEQAVSRAIKDVLSSEPDQGKSVDNADIAHYALSLYMPVYLKKLGDDKAKSFLGKLQRDHSDIFSKAVVDYCFHEKIPLEDFTRKYALENSKEMKKVAGRYGMTEEQTEDFSMRI